ncbi:MULTISPECIES: hypothetical protein [Peribacillus]|uniref:Uncharacterized protein n=1 Tax=Peribacillus asahii TaxID=228899 RepID=A0A3T0KTU8_9BACI|nr:hypothetical protein [Peribacillus asahii]AZV43859.1 hypothetical protein BAOM_3250 [Peribacillus asahii]USK83611.1 hypothetical protein LIT35_14235 [Peribacillus asahii]
MNERKIYLANGDVLIRTAKGIYFRQNGENGTPLLIDQEEGELLAFGTAEQLLIAAKTINKIISVYEKALEQLNEMAVYYSEKEEALNPDKVRDIAAKALNRPEN